jgi:hypothetical protein
MICMNAPLSSSALIEEQEGTGWMRCDAMDPSIQFLLHDSRVALHPSFSLSLCLSEYHRIQVLYIERIVVLRFDGSLEFWGPTEICTNPRTFREGAHFRTRNMLDGERRHHYCQDSSRITQGHQE